MNSNAPSSSSGEAGSTDSSAPRRNSKPKYSRFTQQELPACKLILTPRWVISAFMLVSIVFIPIGVASLFASRDVLEIVDRYETACIPPASRSDKVKFIQSFEDKTCNRTLNLSEQEDLIVSMRTAALPTFRKLYGKIEVDPQENEEIQVILQNNYNTYSFNGKKKLVLSTATWLGGKNDFLGIAYITVGGLCFFLAMVFTIFYLVKPRRLGDPSYLSWNQNPGGH